VRLQARLQEREEQEELEELEEREDTWQALIWVQEHQHPFKQAVQLRKTRIVRATGTPTLMGHSNTRRVHNHVWICTLLKDAQFVHKGRKT
jgi:hypothetical protein